MRIVTVTLFAFLLACPQVNAQSSRVSRFDWAGPYAGLHAGGGFSADDAATLSGDPNIVQKIIDGTTVPILNFAIPASLSTDRSGFVGGAQVGHNWRLAGIVVGVEADISYADLDSSDSRTVTATPINGPPPTHLLQTSLKTDIEWFGTVRGRIGVIPEDWLMIYATGGLAYGHTKQSLSFANAGDGFALISVPSNLTCPQGLACLVGSNSETSVGWTGGGGFELAMGGGVTLKGEYLYVDLGSTTVTAKGTGAPTTPDVFLSAEVENELHVVRGGLNVALD